MVMDEFFIAIAAHYRSISIGEYWRLLVAYLFLAGSRDEVERVRALSPVGTLYVANETNVTLNGNETVEFKLSNINYYLYIIYNF